MKNNNFLKDLHIGRIIKDIAIQNHVQAKHLVHAFHPVRYRDNADKIFKLKDMDLEVIIRISYTLEFNLLEMISEKYLPHLPFSGSNLKEVDAYITLCIRTGHFKIQKKEKNGDWEDIHIGQSIKKIIQQKGWSEGYLAEQLGCDKSLINYYCKRKNMHLKKLIEFSNALKHNLIAEVYLVRMNFFNSLKYLNQCVIKLNTQQNISKNRDEGTFEMTFSPLH